MMLRICLVWATLTFAPVSMAQTSEGHFVRDGEPRIVEGIDLPDRILLGTIDSGDIVVLENIATEPLKTPVHVHHVHHEAVYLLSGRIRVTIGEESEELGAGDFVFMPKSIPHRLEIIEPGRSLIISSNGYDEAREQIIQLLQAGVPMREIYENLEFLEYIAE